MKQETTTKAQKAMRKLGSFGGKSTVEKHGIKHMKKISRDFWNAKKAEKVEKDYKKN